MKKSYFLLVSLLFTLALTQSNIYGQSGWNWAKSGGSTGLDGIRDSYTDSDGNTYVTGTFAGTTATFGTTTLTNADPNGFNGDIFIAKYSSSGDVIWAKSAGGTGNDAGNGIAMDSDGNIYITGEIKGQADFSGTTLSPTNNNTEEIFIAKYNSGGDLQWAERAGGGNRDFGNDIAVDQNGDVYVTGTIKNNAEFGGTPYGTISGNNGDAYVAKYSTNGNFLWLEQVGGINPGGQNSLQSSNAIAYDPSTNTFTITGWYHGLVTWGSTGGIIDSSSAYPSSGDYSIFVANYDSSGVIQWVTSIDEEQVNASGHSEINGIDVDSDGNIYLVGSVAGKLQFNGSTTIEMAHTNSWDFDVFLAKYNTNGNFSWVKQIGGQDGDTGSNLHVDGDGNINIVGNYSEAQTIGPFSLPLSTHGVFLAKYSNSGNVLWAHGEPGAYLSNPKTIGVDAQGRIYVTGDYTNFADFGNIHLEVVDLSDAFIAQYDQTTGTNDRGFTAPSIIHPNPAHDFVIFELQDNQSTAYISIQNLSGQTVISSPYQQNDILNIGHLPSGVYLVDVTNQEKKHTEKLIVSDY